MGRQNPAGTVTGSPVVKQTASTKKGTHFSFLAIGGFIPVTSVAEMNAIPVADTMNDDGYTSGQREPYMEVHIISGADRGKVYVLETPDFEPLTPAQRLAALANNDNFKLRQAATVTPTGWRWSQTPGVTVTDTATGGTVVVSTGAITNGIITRGTPPVEVASPMVFNDSAPGKWREDLLGLNITTAADGTVTLAIDRKPGDEVPTDQAKKQPEIPANWLPICYITVTDGTTALPDPMPAGSYVETSSITHSLGSSKTLVMSQSGVNTQFNADRTRLTELEGTKPVAGQAGFVQTLDANLKRIWAAVVATAGGTIAGALQFRGADGKVTGTDLLSWDTVTRVLKLGAAGFSGKFEIFGSDSVVEAQDGHTLEMLLNNNMTTAFVLKDKVTNKQFLRIRTKTNDEAVVVVENSDVDANIGAPYKLRQGYANTASQAKTYLLQPNTLNEIAINLPFDGNALMFQAELMGVNETGTEAIFISLKAAARRSGGVVTVTNRLPVVDEPAGQGASAGLEATATNDGVKIFVTPANAAMAKEYTWVMYSQYMKI